MFNNEDIVDERRSIPMDLFPIVDTRLDERWARSTFGYYHLFDESCDTLVPENQAAIIKWLNKAKEIRSELRQMGNDYGERQVLYLAQTIFDLKMLGSEHIYPTKVMDIVAIYGDSYYYNRYKERNIQQLYQLMYGLTKNGGNSWLLRAEAEWMQDMGIRYKQRTSCLKQTGGRSRGCIYQHLSNCFSNTNIKRFRMMMIRQHKEILYVREKEGKRNDIVEVTKIRCSSGYAYLGTLKGNEETERETEMEIFNQLEEEGKTWVRRCLDIGLEVERILEMVALWGKYEFLEQNNNTVNRQCGK